MNANRAAPLQRHKHQRMVRHVIMEGMKEPRSWRGAWHGTRHGNLSDIQLVELDCKNGKNWINRLCVSAIGVYLRGEMRVEDNDIGWSSSVRNVGKDMERIVRDLMRIRASDLVSYVPHVQEPGTV